ncbi:MAG: CesT family type III secretion system chaperone [Pseudomonadota bacterium]
MSGQPDSSVLSLVSALSDAIGQPLQLDARGECAMEFNGPGEPTTKPVIDVVLARAADPEILSIRSQITQPGQVLQVELLELALGLNYTRVPPGYCIALDPSSRQLMLVALFDAERVSQDEFLHAIAGFLELIPQLRQECVAALQSRTEEAHEMIAMGVLA